MSIIVFDIGASNMRVAELTATGIGPIAHAKTPTHPLRAVEALARLVRGLRGEVDAFYGGIPAIVEADGSVASATNLPAWKGFPFTLVLERMLGVPVHARNDAELAGLGEAIYGAAKGYRTVAYLGLGTGVGTSRIVDGVIEPHSSDGSARDAVIALSGGGTLESRIGGRSLYLRLGAHPEELPRTVWGKLTLTLAEGIENAVRLWEPDVVVLGGSLMNEKTGFRIKEIQNALAVHSPHVLTVSLRAAQLRDASGLYGAKAWAERESAA